MRLEVVKLKAKTLLELPDVCVVSMWVTMGGVIVCGACGWMGANVDRFGGKGCFYINMFIHKILELPDA